MTELCSICLAARASMTPPRELEALIRINLPWLEEHAWTAAPPAPAVFAGPSGTSEPPAWPTVRPRRFCPPRSVWALPPAIGGSGVTIAFLDAGFYAHPDLVTPKDRIREYVDVTRADSRRSDLDDPRDAGLARHDDVGGGVWKRRALPGPLSRNRVRGRGRSRAVRNRAARVSPRHSPGFRLDPGEPPGPQHPDRERQRGRRLRGELPRGPDLRGGGGGHPSRDSRVLRGGERGLFAPASGAASGIVARPPSPWAA